MTHKSLFWFHRKIKNQLSFHTMLILHRISATNNSRKFYGSTYLEDDDPLVQRINLVDDTQRNDTYQIIFTPEQLCSSDTFCREITEIIDCKYTSYKFSFYISI